MCILEKRIGSQTISRALLLIGQDKTWCTNWRRKTVERLDCKRPILWLASSKILKPHPPHRGEDSHTGHPRRVERGLGGQYLEDARHSSVLDVCKYFVWKTLGVKSFYTGDPRRDMSSPTTLSFGDTLPSSKTHVHISKVLERGM
jgi:hypothetical protein